jgi:hypothetical protein
MILSDSDTLYFKIAKHTDLSVIGFRVVFINTIEGWIEIISVIIV